jgi:MFS-type transporter involved in bile tolerance (Atg22 family)
LPVAWVACDVLAFELFGDSDSVAGYGASDAAMGALLFAVLANWVVVGADSAALRRSGVRVSAWWGVLILPLYVILRTRRARRSPIVPAVFFALAAAYLLSGELILDGLDLH